MALARLERDRSLDGVVRDVLLYFRHRPNQVLSVEQVAHATGHPMTLVEPILLTLSQCFVLDFQSDLASFRYVPDAVLELDLERFLQSVRTAQGKLQDNVARFRQRQSNF